MRRTGISAIRILLALTGSLLLGLAVCSPSALAQVKPGDFITPDNAARVRELVSPGVYLRLLHGMSMKIAPTERIEWPPPYTEATEKYSAQVRLSSDHRSLVGYVAGEPFPLIDPNDPYAGTKVMWNNTFRPISSDDYDLRDFDCSSQYWGADHPPRVVEYFEMGHLAGYALVGRTEVEPTPIDPEFRESGRMIMFGFYPTLTPAANRGFGGIRYRYADPQKSDDAWTWHPGARRVRRTTEAFLGTAADAQTFSFDDFQGFNAKNENYNFKLLGEKNMLAPVDVENVPPKTCPTDGGASVCPERWQMRRLYIVEATARRDRVPEELYSKRVLYLDSEAVFVMYDDLYDRRGELWKNSIFWMAYRDRPVPDARVAIYPFKREFQVVSSPTDLQSGLNTTCFHPAKSGAGHESYYINMGSLDKAFFTVQSLVKAAP